MLSSTFGVLALVLSAVGLYGVIANAVSRRRKELGIRLALGAEPRRILRLVLGEAGLLIALGVAVGLPCALFERSGDSQPALWGPVRRLEERGGRTRSAHCHCGMRGMDSRPPRVTGRSDACVACGIGTSRREALRPDSRLLSPQRDHRIDAGGATRGNRAGRQCRERQQQERRRERARIGRLDAEQECPGRCAQVPRADAAEYQA